MEDKKSNIGFDFDVNFYVNDDEEKYSPKNIRTIIGNALNKVVCDYGYSHCEDSTSVLTIKFVDCKNSRILHSCDFAIVKDCYDGRQQYIRCNKKHQTYTWEYRRGEYLKLPQKIEWVKKQNLWGELRNYYLDKKNRNNNPDKKSCSILAEAVNYIYQKNRYRSTSQH